MFWIATDLAQRLVRLTAGGFFSEAEIEAAAAELHRAIRGLEAGPGGHVTLYDLAELRVASQTMIGRFAEFFTSPAFAPIRAARVAVVTRSALVTLQMERVANAVATMQVFSDTRGALAWLLADQDRFRTTSQPTRASG